MNIYLILPLILVIAACSGGDGEMTVSPVEDYEESGAAVIKMDRGELRIATGASALARMPMDISVYPGAEIQTSMSGVGDGKAGHMVVFKVDDTAERRIEFYRNELESKNIMFKKEVRSGDMLAIGGERSDGEGVQITVTKSPDGGATLTIVASGNR